MINLIKIPRAPAQRNKNNKQNYTMLLFENFLCELPISLVL